MHRPTAPDDHNAEEGREEEGRRHQRKRCVMCDSGPSCGVVCSANNPEPKTGCSSHAGPTKRATKTSVAVSITRAHSTCLLPPFSSIYSISPATAMSSATSNGHVPPVLATIAPYITHAARPRPLFLPPGGSTARPSTSARSSVSLVPCPPTR